MPPKISRGTIAAIIAGLAAVFVVIWPPYFATLDGPQYIYHAYILKTWPTLADWYRPTIPFASVGFPAILLPLSLVLPWPIAYRLAIGAVAALWSFSAISLAKALNPQRTFIAVLGSTLVLGWALSMGFFSFLMGTAMAGLGVAAALDENGLERKSAIKTQLLLTLAIVTHLFAGTLGVGAVCALHIFREGTLRDRFIRLISRIAVPAVLVVVLVTVSHEDVLPEGENVYLEGTDRVLSIAKMGFGGPLWRAAPPTLLAIFMAVKCLFEAREGRGNRNEWGLALFVIVCLVCSIFAPLHLPGWMHLASRFIPLALLIGVSLVPMERFSDKHLPLAAAAIGIFCVASIAWFGNYFQKLSAEIAPLLDVLRAPVVRANKTGSRLPVLAQDPFFSGIGTMDAAFPYADPAFNIPLLVAIEQGGMVPYTFTTTSLIHPFVDKPGHPPLPRIPPREYFWLGLIDPEVKAKPQLRRALLIDVASQGSRFDDVALFGSPEDQKVFDNLGFEANWRSDIGYLATFKGCPMKLGLKGPENAPTNLNVSYGWFPLMEPIWTAQVTRSEELTKVELPGAPCGPIWVEIQNNGSPFVCAGAQRDGRLVAFERTKEKAILCNLVAAGQ